MKKHSIFFSGMIIICLTIAACSNLQKRRTSVVSPSIAPSSSPAATQVVAALDTDTGQDVPLPVNQVALSEEILGGEVGNTMTPTDRNKMFRALDKPIGKATTWRNARQDITYTIVPTAKISKEGNPYCRYYSSSMIQGDTEKTYSGTACIATDGNWHAVK